jgi:hypothetical protein
MRSLLLAVALLVPAIAGAAERSLYFGSIDRVRVQGPYRVTVSNGSPGGKVSGDSTAINDVDTHVDGTTLVIRPRTSQASRSGSASGFGSAPTTTEPVTIALTTPNLVSASVAGSANVTIAQMKGDRVDLSVSGPGSIQVDALNATHTNATLLGAGAIRLAGRSGDARLLASGEGSLDAAKLDAGELTVHLDGNGEISASARYAAQVINSGLGRVTIAGNAKCRVAPGGGPVTCGR